MSDPAALRDFQLDNPVVVDAASEEVVALRELAADLAESAPFYTDGDRLVCALCDAVGDFASMTHDPCCLIARAQALIARQSAAKDAFEALDALGT
jgi:hypothetical protein